MKKLLKTLLGFTLLTMLLGVIGNLGGCGNSEARKAEKQRTDSIKQAKADSIQIAEIAAAEQAKIAEIAAAEQAEIAGFEKEKSNYNRTIELRKKYLNFKYVFPENSDFLAENGTAKALDGTDNNYFVAYFKKGDLTVVMNKKTSRFENICPGRNSNLKYDQTVKLSKLLNKRMEYYDFQDEISSTRYGGSETLGKTMCLNTDCVHYYPKGNFTVVTLFETGEGERADMMTLKKIAIGKVPRLAEF